MSEKFNPKNWPAHFPTKEELFARNNAGESWESIAESLGFKKNEKGKRPQFIQFREAHGLGMLTRKEQNERNKNAGTKWRTRDMDGFERELNIRGDRTEFRRKLKFYAHDNDLPQEDVWKKAATAMGWTPDYVKLTKSQEEKLRRSLDPAYDDKKREQEKRQAKKKQEAKASPPKPAPAVSEELPANFSPEHWPESSDIKDDYQWAWDNMGKFPKPQDAPSGSAYALWQWGKEAYATFSKMASTILAKKEEKPEEKIIRDDSREQFRLLDQFEKFECPHCGEPL